MTLRVCSQPGCPSLQPEPKCPTHRSQAERQRGTRQERGYDAGHEAERKRWAPLVATGNVKCWRCREHIPADAAWDLGHDDRDRSKYRGPECRPCNRATSGR
jgi:hypothetical protein